MDKKVKKMQPVLNEKQRFSGHLFLIHITSRKFWIWLLYSYFINDIIHNGTTADVKFALAIGWIVISVIYMIGEPIEKGIGMMFENAKIAAEFKAGVQATVNTDTAKVMEAVSGNKLGVEGEKR
jgi:hypothetical protein